MSPLSLCAKSTERKRSECDDSVLVFDEERIKMVTPCTIRTSIAAHTQFISAVTSQNDATAPTVHKDDTKHAKASIHAVCSTPRSQIHTSRHDAQKASSEVPKEQSHRVSPMPSTCVVVRTAQPRAGRHTHKSLSEPEHSPPPAFAARPPPRTAATGRRAAWPSCPTPPRAAPSAMRYGVVGSGRPNVVDGRSRGGRFFRTQTVWNAKTFTR